MAKGLHSGTGGRVAKFMVAITYREGVIPCEQYDTLNRAYFKDLIDREFESMFRDTNKGKSKPFMQDGDPSKNSALARFTWQEIRGQLMSLPPRSGHHEN